MAEDARGDRPLKFDVLMLNGTAKFKVFIRFHREALLRRRKKKLLNASETVSTHEHMFVNGYVLITSRMCTEITCMDIGDIDPTKGIPSDGGQNVNIKLLQGSASTWLRSGHRLEQRLRGCLKGVLEKKILSDERFQVRTTELPSPEGIFCSCAYSYG